MQVRYIKILIDTLCQTGYMILSELRAKTANDTNKMLTATVVNYSSELGANYSPAKLIDGDASGTSAWASSTNYATAAVNGTEYATFDLGGVYDIAETDVIGSLAPGDGWTGGQIAAYRLQFSTNGTDFTTVTTFTGGANTSNRQDTFNYAVTSQPQVIGGVS